MGDPDSDSGTVAGCNESLLRLSCEDIQLLFKD